jgi:thiamine biosynthesis lipoprotein
MVKTREITHTFQAMNTDITGIICEVPENCGEAARALTKVELLFRKIERALSRFQVDSELTYLNNSAGQPFTASELLIAAVKAALEAALLTGGIFDPTVLPALLAAGYNRSFEKIGQDGHILHPEPPFQHCDWQKIIINATNRTILLPAGCRLDLGGIGKGWAVDQAYQILRSFPDFALDAGGDIRVQGHQIDEQDWCVGVDDPLKPGHNLTILHLNRGAICTSSTVKRKWLWGDKTLHHLIDPLTGMPTQSGVISATVIADTAARAEVLAKAALIAGPIRGLQLIEKQPGCQGLMSLDDGATLSVGMEVASSVA